MKARAITTLLSLAAISMAGAACTADTSDPADDSDGMEVELNSAGFPIVPCPDDLEFSLDMEATGEDGLFKARLVDADPAPPERYRNDWTIELMDIDGAPLEEAEITRSQAYMPAHNHNGGYQTEVSMLEEPGQFQVDYLNMFMGGPWEVQLWVTAGDDEDYIVFDVCIEE